MKVFRVAVAIVLVVCALPIAVFAFAWVISAVGGCTLQFEAAHVCTLGRLDVGWLLDALLPIGVLGAVTFGAGVYVFAAWVTVELAAIVLNALRRNSRGR